MVCGSMGRIEKGVTCSVTGCAGKAVRSVSSTLAERTGLKFEESRRVYLCEAHYKEFKKKNRKDQRLERLRWGV